MIDTTRLLLESFPLTVDPSACVLEVAGCPVRVRGGVPEPAGSSRWLPLFRLLRGGRHLPAPLDLSCVHLFADSLTAREARLLLVYDSTGHLRRRYDRSAPGLWDEPHVFAPEQVGAPLLRPSVRLVFATLESAQRFHALAAAPLPGDTRSMAELLAVLLCQVEAPRLLPVSPGEVRRRGGGRGG